MFPNRSVKATGKWRNSVDELPKRSGVYLTAWASGSARWIPVVQWYSAEDKHWEATNPDMWSPINLPYTGRGNK